MALFAIVGGLAVDCVRQDHPEHLPKLVEAIADVVEDDLAAWINDNGGWVNKDLFFQKKKNEILAKRKCV